MSLIKNSKLWSNLVLFASIACVVAMFLSLVGIRQEWFSSRDAGTYIRYGVQAGLVIMALAVLVMIFARKNTAALVKGFVAFLIMLAPLLIVKANMPAGTTIIAQPRPAGPPAGAAGGMGGGGMGAGGMGGMGGGAPTDPATAPTNDISTDMVNPPAYVAVLPLRPEGANAAEYAGLSASSAQTAQFPEIKPINSSLSKDAAFARALEIADDMGWEIIAQDSSTGIFEAVASTMFFNYQDDVVVRVTDNAAGSIVDIRSHSRIGRGDRGKNAQRVNAFIKKFG